MNEELKEEDVILYKRAHVLDIQASLQRAQGELTQDFIKIWPLLIWTS